MPEGGVGGDGIVPFIALGPACGGILASFGLGGDGMFELTPFGAVTTVDWGLGGATFDDTRFASESIPAAAPLMSVS